MNVKIKGPPGNRMPPHGFICMELLFSHVWLRRYLLWGGSTQQAHWTSAVTSPGDVWFRVPGCGGSTVYHRKKGNKTAMKSRGGTGSVWTRDEASRRNDEWRFANKLYISEILVSWFMSQPGGVTGCDICSRAKQAHNTVPSQSVHFIIPPGCGGGGLQLSWHPWPKQRNTTKHLNISVATLELKAVKMLLAMNKQNKIRSTSEMTVTLFKPP